MRCQFLHEEQKQPDLISSNNWISLHEIFWPSLKQDTDIFFLIIDIGSEYSRNKNKSWIRTTATLVPSNQLHVIIVSLQHCENEKRLHLVGDVDTFVFCVPQQDWNVRYLSVCQLLK